ncbi:hypothetical protein [uncultured Robinsoniella sp.]
MDSGGSHEQYVISKEGTDEVPDCRVWIRYPFLGFQDGFVIRI